MSEASDFLYSSLDSLNIGSGTADLLRLILSQVGEGILVINVAREVVFINEVATQLLGTRETPPPDTDWSAFYGFFLPDTVTPYPAGRTPLILALKGQSFNDAQFFVRNGSPESRCQRVRRCSFVRFTCWRHRIIYHPVHADIAAQMFVKTCFM